MSTAQSAAIEINEKTEDSPDSRNSSNLAAAFAAINEVSSTVGEEKTPKSFTQALSDARSSAENLKPVAQETGTSIGSPEATEEYVAHKAALKEGDPIFDQRVKREQMQMAFAIETLNKIKAEKIKSAETPTPQPQASVDLAATIKKNKSRLDILRRVLPLSLTMFGSDTKSSEVWTGLTEEKRERVSSKKTK